MAASDADIDNLDEENARKLKDFLSANLTNVEVKDEHKVSIGTKGGI